MLIHTYLMVVPSSNGGPQVCEIGDWKNLPQALRKNSSVSQGQSQYPQLSLG